MKIFIAPLGDPSSYGEVTYRWNSKIGERKGTLRSRSSIPLTIKKVKPDISLILISDTAGINQLSNKISYKHIREGAESAVRNLIGIPDEEGAIKIEVLPAKGQFKNKDRNRPIVFQFQRDVEDYKRELFFKVTQTILEKLKGVKDFKVDFFLDITHGVNFMIEALIKDVNRIGGVLSFFGSEESKSKLYIFNSDPFIPSERFVPSGSSNPKRDKQVLNINQVESDRFISGVPAWRIEKNKKIMENTNLEIDPNTRKYLNGLIGGFYYKLPLLIVYCISKIELKELENKLSEAVSKKYEELTKKDFKSDRIGTISLEEKIARFSVSKGFTLTCCDTASIKFQSFSDYHIDLSVEQQKMLEKLTLDDNHSYTETFEIATIGLLLGGLTKRYLSRTLKNIEEEGVESEILEKIAELDGFSFAKAETDSLAERIEDNLTNLNRDEWYPLSILWSKNDQQRRISSKRNFVAHGGFERNITEFKIEEKVVNDKREIKIRYRYKKGIIDDIINNYANPKVKR